MSKVFAFTITRAMSTDKRWELVERTLNEGKEKAGMEFEWKLYSNAVVNKGQHVVTNDALKEAKDRGFDYLLRIDDDIEFMSQRWLAKMLEASEKLGSQFIISPTVSGLKHPPEMSQVIDINGISVKFLTEAVGGACRLHPIKLLTEAPTPYISDVRFPLGAGDATGIMKWAKTMTVEKYPVYAVWLEHVRVRHQTAKQEVDDPDYHFNHDLLQSIPYIPSWPSAYA